MIEIADYNFTAEPGVDSVSLVQAQSGHWGLDLSTDLIPIRDRTVARSACGWTVTRWAAIRDGRIYYKTIGLNELPPDWATHIYKPLPL